MPGFIPSLPKNEIKRLIHTLDRIEAGESNGLLLRWMDRQRQRMGEQAFGDWYVNRAQHDLNAETFFRYNDVLLATMPPEIHSEVTDKAMSTVYQMLMDEGLQPGVDFSRHDGGVVISDKAAQVLQDMVGSEAWEQLGPHLQSMTSDPWEALEDRLGVPFRANLLHRLGELARSEYPPGAIACWISIVSACVGHQVTSDDEDPQLFGLLLKRLKDRHKQRFQQVMGCFETEEVWDPEQLMDVEVYPMVDVLRAAGATEENGELLDAPEGGAISRSGMKRLSLVWRGDRPVGELIAATLQLPQGWK